MKIKITLILRESHYAHIMIYALLNNLCVNNTNKFNY